MLFLAVFGLLGGFRPLQFLAIVPVLCVKWGPGLGPRHNHDIPSIAM